MVHTEEGRNRARHTRNRKRSKRRAIYCPVHNCYLDSASPKYPLFADKPGQLQERGLGRQPAQLVVDTYGSVMLQGEWIEAFWCKLCDRTEWYHVRLYSNRTYQVQIAPPELWQQAVGVIHPSGNPSVSEFTRRISRMNRVHGLKSFNFMK
ncbi:MAG: hypothetical protein AAGF24_00975 [Cyanobacteria bacterium P01_H01_bin.121]